MSAKTKEIAASIMDQEEEPLDVDGKECTELQLMKGLNFYAARSDSEQLKKYAIIWAETHAPDLLEKIKNASRYNFITWGAVARLHSRGFKLGEKYLVRLRAHFENLQQEDRPVVEKLVKTKLIRTNLTLLSLDDALDAVLQGNTANVAFDPKDDINEIILHCKEKLKELEDPEGYPRAAVKLLRQVYEGTLAKCAAVRTSKKSVGGSSKKKPPEMIASKVKYQKEDAALKLTSLRPHELIGARKAYVYDTSRRRLYVYKATDAGFTFKGTTLLNVNMEDSHFKLVRKPETILKLTARPGISDLNKIFNALTTKETLVPATRFSESCVVINYAN